MGKCKVDAVFQQKWCFARPLSQHSMGLQAASSAPLLGRHSRDASVDGDRDDGDDDESDFEMHARTPEPHDGDDDPRSHSLMADLAQPGSSLFEKKCILINREIDSHGMGRYQWCIWALCGFGYLLDLLWAQAFGLVLSPIQQEFGFNSEHAAMSPASKIGP